MYTLLWHLSSLICTQWINNRLICTEWLWSRRWKLTPSRGCISPCSSICIVQYMEGPLVYFGLQCCSELSSFMLFFFFAQLFSSNRVQGTSFPEAYKTFYSIAGTGRDFFVNSVFSFIWLLFSVFILSRMYSMVAYTAQCWFLCSHRGRARALLLWAATGASNQLAGNPDLLIKCHF